MLTDGTVLVRQIRDESAQAESSRSPGTESRLGPFGRGREEETTRCGWPSCVDVGIDIDIGIKASINVGNRSDGNGIDGVYGIPSSRKGDNAVGCETRGGDSSVGWEGEGGL